MSAKIGYYQNKVRTCILCDETKIYYNFSLDENYRVEKCLNCSLMSLNPQPTAFENIRIEKQKNSQNEDDIIERYFNFLSAYTRFKPIGNLLYIGEISDQIKKALINKSMNVEFIAFNPHSPEAIENSLNALNERNSCFDYVMSINVLQRVRNPRILLSIIHRLLKENGVIMMVLPNLDSLPARIMKSRWPYFNKENLWYFPQDTLSRMFYTENYSELKLENIKEKVSIEYFSENLSRYHKEPFSALIKCSGILPSILRKYQFSLKASNSLILAKAKKIFERKKLSVIMPAYNEANLIKNTIDKVLQKEINGIEIELIIIESNSTDGTREIVRDYEKRNRVTIIWQAFAKGKGNAVREGLSKATGDYILIQDADSEYDIEDYDALIEPLLNGESSFVLGARHGGVAWKMRQFGDQKFFGHFLNFGHWIFTALVNIVYGLNLKDPFTMYKIFRADCLKGIKLESNRFDFDYELLIKLVRRGYHPIEIPVNYRSRSFKEGKKIRVFRDPFNWLFAIIKYRFQKI